MKLVGASVGSALALAAVLLGAGPSGGQGPPDPKALTTDEAAIRESVRQIEQGWNTKQAALFARPFAEDADYVAINGFHGRGRRHIEDAHEQLFRTRYRHSTITLVAKQVRMVRPDVAIVHVAGHNRTGQGDAIQEWAMIVSLVMTKESDRWTIVSFQNTRVDSVQR